jgi:hypothetical protein
MRGVETDATGAVHGALELAAVVWAGKVLLGTINSKLTIRG